MTTNERPRGNGGDQNVSDDITSMPATEHIGGELRPNPLPARSGLTVNYRTSGDQVAAGILWGPGPGAGVTWWVRAANGFALVHRNRGIWEETALPKGLSADGVPLATEHVLAAPVIQGGLW